MLRLHLLSLASYGLQATFSTPLLNNEYRAVEQAKTKFSQFYYYCLLCSVHWSPYRFATKKEIAIVNVQLSIGDSSKACTMQF